MTNPTPEEIRKQIDRERLLTLARMHRANGDYRAADGVVVQLLELDPEDLDIRELAADLLFARGNLEKAAAYYRTLYSAEHPRASAEEKYATAIVQIAEGRRQQNLLAYRQEHPLQHPPEERSPLWAALASTAPGFGQIYCGQLVKGIVIFVVCMILWKLFSISLPDVSVLPEDVRMRTFGTSIGPASIFYAALGVSIQAYALIDAVMSAQKTKPKDKSL